MDEACAWLHLTVTGLLALESRFPTL